MTARLCRMWAVLMPAIGICAHLTPYKCNAEPRPGGRDIERCSRLLSKFREIATVHVLLHRASAEHHDVIVLAAFRNPDVDCG